MKMERYGAKKSESMADFGFPIFCFWVQAFDSLLQVNESVNTSEAYLGKFRL